MNVRGGSIILRTLGVLKNCSMKKALVILSHMSGGGGGGSANHGQLTTNSPLLPFNNRRTLPSKWEDRWGIVYYLLYS